MFFTCSRCAPGALAGDGRDTHMAQVSSFFSPSLLYKKSPSLALPALSPSRSGPATRLGRFSVPSPAPLCLLLPQGKEKSPGAARGKLGCGFFSRDEASMERSGVELWGGQREKQREGRNKAR